MAVLNDNERAIVSRILDANANRCAEGLRVVEEIVRFSLDDRPLLERYKEIRHAVRRCMESITENGYRFRDSEGDVGRTFSTRSEAHRGSLDAVAKANFARAEEALRVMEEFGKLLDPDAAFTFKQLRFELYTLEGGFFGREGVGPRLPQCPFLYALLDRMYVSGDDVAAVAGHMVGGGADIIQYRAKEIGTGERRNDLMRIITAAARKSVPVIVNDDPELAAEVGAAGVHLGAGDPAPDEARAILGPEALVGLTMHSMAEFESAPPGRIDYVASGSVFPSKTKEDVAAIGLDHMRELKERSAVPVVAIGGITMKNIDSVLDTGVDGVAIVSAILEGDVESNCRAFRGKIDDWMSSKGFSGKG